MNFKVRLTLVGIALVITNLACLERWMIGSADDHTFTAEQTLNAIGAATDEALAAAMAQATQNVKCAGLSSDECANVGTHFYEIVRNPIPNPGECSYSEWAPSREPREITFDNSKLFVSNYASQESYEGHTRVAEDVYEWVNPVDGGIHTITFTDEGYIESSNNGACGWNISHTFSD
jgi:hypothetical protein